MSWLLWGKVNPFQIADIQKQDKSSEGYITKVTMSNGQVWQSVDTPANVAAEAHRCIIEIMTPKIVGTEVRIEKVEVPVYKNIAIHGDPKFNADDFKKVKLWCDQNKRPYMRSDEKESLVRLMESYEVKE